MVVQPTGGPSETCGGDLADADRPATPWCVIAAAATAVLAAVGYAVTAPTGPGVVSDPGAPYVLPVLGALLTFTLASWLTALLHELGHVAAARRVGFEFRSLLVGPALVEKVGGRLALRWQPAHGHRGGLVRVAPRGTDRLVERLAIHVAGGPATDLAVFAASVGVAALLPSSGWGDPRRLIPASAALAAAIQLAINLYPRRLASGYLTDGARLLILRRRGPLAERDAALLAMEAAPGARLGDLDPGLIERATSTPDGTPEHANACLWAHCHALARGDVESACRWLDQALDGADRYYADGRAALLLLGAYFVACCHRDAARARLLLDRARGGAAPAHERALAEAAVLLAEGDRDGAMRCVEDAERLSGRVADPALAEYGVRRAQVIRHLASRYPAEGDHSPSP